MPQNSNDPLENTVRKALRDSVAEPYTRSIYDPPTDPELREVYDEIYWLASRSTFEVDARNEARRPTIQIIG